MEHFSTGCLTFYFIFLAFGAIPSSIQEFSFCVQGSFHGDQMGCLGLSLYPPNAKQTPYLPAIGSSPWVFHFLPCGLHLPLLRQYRGNFLCIFLCLSWCSNLYGVTQEGPTPAAPLSEGPQRLCALPTWPPSGQGCSQAYQHPLPLLLKPCWAGPPLPLLLPCLALSSFLRGAPKNAKVSPPSGGSPFHPPSRVPPSPAA